MSAKKIFEIKKTREIIQKFSFLMGFQPPFFIDNQVIDTSGENPTSLFFLIEANPNVHAKYRHFSAFNTLLMDTLNVEIVLIDKDILAKAKLSKVLENSLDLSADETQIEKYFSEKPHLETLHYKQIERNNTFSRRLNLAKRFLEQAQNAIKTGELTHETKPVFSHDDSPISSQATASSEKILDNLLHEKNMPYVKSALLALFDPDQIAKIEEWVNAEKLGHRHDIRKGSELPAPKKRKL